MPTGIPKGKGSDIAPLPHTRLDNVPLIAMGAFQVTSKKTDRKTGREYEKDEIKLSLDFDSGEIMRDSQGEPVLDDNGNERPHLINVGFTTLSGHAKANFVGILKALGFNGDHFIVKSGNDAGGLTQQAMESVEVQFGTNGLGDDYSRSGWEDLPFYVVGGDQAKRDVEVPILSFKILGFEVLGRRCDMTLKIDDKGYNKPELFMPPRDAEPLGGMPKSKPVRGISKPKQQDEDTPFDPEPKPTPAADYPTPTSRAAVFVDKKMDEANVPQAMRHRVAVLVSGMDDFPSIAEITSAAAKNIRDMLKADPGSIKEAWDMVMSGKPEAVDADDDFDDDEEDL